MPIDWSGGATQWRHECDCLPEVAEERITQKWFRMHSEVSFANVSFFISEGRVADDVTEEELLMLKEQFDHVIVCNVCQSIKGLGGADDDADVDEPTDQSIAGFS